MIGQGCTCDLGCLIRVNLEAFARIPGTEMPSLSGWTEMGKHITLGMLVDMRWPRLKMILQKVEQ